MEIKNLCSYSSCMFALNHNINELIMLINTTYSQNATFRIKIIDDINSFLNLHVDY